MLKIIVVLIVLIGFKSDPDCQTCCRSTTVYRVRLALRRVTWPMLCERYFQVRPSSLHSDHFSSLFEAFLVYSFFHSTLRHYQVIRVVHFKASLYKFYSFLTFFIDCEFRSDLKWRLFALLPSAAGLSRKKTAKLNFFPVLSSKTMKFTLFSPPNSSDNPIFNYIS